MSGWGCVEQVTCLPLFFSCIFPPALPLTGHEQCRLLVPPGPQRIPEQAKRRELGQMCPPPAYPMASSLDPTRRPVDIDAKGAVVGS